MPRLEADGQRSWVPVIFAAGRYTLAHGLPTAILGAGGRQVREVPRQVYSHSIVAGGLDVTSRTTRFTSRTSFVMRVEIRSSTS